MEIYTFMHSFMCFLYSVFVCWQINLIFLLCHISGTTQAGDGTPDLQRALISIISTPTRVDGDPDRLTVATMTATDTRLLPRRLPSRSEDEPCLRTTSASTAATAGRRRFLWRPARRWARWRKELAASGEEKLPTLPSQTGRRRRLPRDRHPRSGSSFTAGERLTTPCSPPLLLLLLTPSLPPLTPQRDTMRLTPPHTSLYLKHPDRGPTVFLQRGRKCRRAARDAAAARLKPRSTLLPTPRPIRINHRCRNTLSLMLRPIRIRLNFRNCPLLLRRRAPCSPGGPSDRWLRPRKRGTWGACMVNIRRGRRFYRLCLHLHQQGTAWAGERSSKLQEL